MSWFLRLFRKKNEDRTEKRSGSNESKPSLLSKFDSYYTIPDLTVEEETRMINKLAEDIVSRGMDVPAVAFLSVEMPVSTILSQTMGVMVAPFAELMGIPGYYYVALFNKKENVERLITRIEELRDRKQK